MEITTTDTYEATFYLYHHAEIISIKKRKVQDNKVKKKGYYIEAKITLGNVNEKDKKSWDDEKAYGNLVAFSHIRCKLKRLIYNWEL
jgi:hypothetical protein